MKELNKHRITMIGFLMLFAYQFVVIFSYLNAYTGNGKTVVHINLLGEQYFDALVITIVLATSTIALILFYKQHQVILSKEVLSQNILSA